MFYTKNQINEIKKRSYRAGWVAGQDSGIRLQGDFTREFFKLATWNQHNLTYSIPKEAHDILKDRFMIDNQPKEEQK